MTTSMWIGVIGFIILILLIFSRIWIGFAMIGVGFIGLFALKGFGFATGVLGSEPFTQATAYELICMPTFCIMGSVIVDCGMSDKLYNAAKAFIGHIRGGLGMATVSACGVFAAICGNSQITAMTLGKVAFPEMVKHGYDESIAAGGIAAGGGIGIMIPPSVGFILYGMLTEQSIGKLFICGLIPGILQVVMFCAVFYIIARVRPEKAPRSEKTTMKQKLNSLKGVWSTLILIIIMLGGIYGGFYTATEAGAIGAIGSIVIAFATKSITWKRLWIDVVEGARMSAAVLILLIGAKVFLRFITASGLATYLTNFIIGLDVSKYVILFFVFILYLILGAVFDIMAGLMLTIPFLFPIMTTIGFDPFWFGVFVVAMMELGEITPPIGLTIFILSDAVKLPVAKVYKGVVPFICASFLFILILCVFPKIALLLI